MNRSKSSSPALGALLAAVTSLLWSCDRGNLLTPESSFPPPESVSPTALGPTSIRVQWAHDPSSRVTSYKLERRVGLEGEFAHLTDVAAREAAQVTYLDTGLEPGTFYGYRVRSLGSLGAISEPSVVGGARTASPPAVEVSTLTNAPNPESADEDGYVVRITGTQSQTISVGTNDVKRSGPLPAGTYQVAIEGVRSSCVVVGSTSMTVTVTDVGTTTVAPVRFEVACKDPTRGEIRVEIATTGQLPTTPYSAILTGVVPLASGDSALSITRSLNAARTTVWDFLNLLPGEYEVELRGFSPTACALQGSATRDDIDVSPLSADTVRYRLECADDVAQNPNAPYVVTNRWQPDVSPTGSKVVLVVGLNATARPTVPIPALQALIQWDSTVARYDSAQVGASFSQLFAAYKADEVGIDLNAFSTTGGATGVLEVAKLHFTIVGVPGTTVRTRTSRDPQRLVVSVGTEQTALSLDSVGIVEDTLRVGTGGGSVPLKAEAGGPYNGLVGQPVTLNGGASTGAPVLYKWQFGDGTPADSSAASSRQHTYAAAGTYQAILTVKAANGTTSADTATVTITAQTTGQANILGRWVSGTGAPITSASPGASVRFQVCTTLNDMAAFQAFIQGFASLASNTANADLNSGGSGVHPDCVGTTDELDDFYTASGTSDPVNAQVVSTGPGVGVGRQGIFEFRFEIRASATGTLQVQVPLESVVVSRLNSLEVTPVLDIAPLTIGGTAPPPAGSYAWKSTWVPDSISGSEPVVLETRIKPGPAVFRVLGEIDFDSTRLAFDSADVATLFSQWDTVRLVRAGRVRIAAQAPTTAPAAAGAETLVARLFFTAQNSGIATTGTSGVVLFTPPLLPIPSGTLAKIEDTLRIGAGVANARPTAEANGPYDGTVGAPVSFTASGSIDQDGSIVGFNWEFGDGAVGVGPAPLHSYASAGSYTARLTVRDNGGRTASDTARVTILSTRPPIAEANGPYAGPVGIPITFSASGSQDSDGSIVRFHWDFGDGSTGLGPSPSREYTQPGTYTARLTVTDDKGASGTDSALVTVTEPPSYALKSAWISIPQTAPSGPLAVAAPSGSAGPGDRVRLRISTKPGVSVAQVEAEVVWNTAVVRYDSIKGNALWDTYFQPVLRAPNLINVAGTTSTPAAATAESVVAELYFTVIGLEGQSMTTTTQLVRLWGPGLTPISTSGLVTLDGTLDVNEGGEPGPNQAPNAEAGGPYTATPGTAVTLSASGSSDPDGSITRFGWNFGDGTIVPNGSISPSHTYVSAGTYTVTLTVTDNGGLTDTDQATVTVASAGGAGGGGGPTGNLIGRWVSSTGTPITTAVVGATVKFQFCTTITNLQAYQSNFEGFAPRATLTAGGDLNSGAASGVHPHCAGTTDELNDFYTASGTTDPINAQIVSTAASPGTGTQGIFELTFLLTSAGTLRLTIPESGSTAPVVAVYAGTSAPPALTKDIQALTITP